VLDAFKKLKAENAFEVRRPRTTKEVAVHNNQLLQQLLVKLDQMAKPATAGEVAGWSQAIYEQPQAPRVTPEEMEDATAQQTEQLRKHACGNCPCVNNATLLCVPAAFQ
jgi:hypothetical protein